MGSFWRGAELTIDHTLVTGDPVYRSMSVRLERGRFEVEHWPEVLYRYEETRQRGFDARFGFSRPHAGGLSVWSGPARGGGGRGVSAFTLRSYPLVYPLLAGAGLGVWLIRRRCSPRGRDGCPSCGYALDGLTGAVCPECGDTIAHD